MDELIDYSLPLIQTEKLVRLAWQDLLDKKHIDAIERLHEAQYHLTEAIVAAKVESLKGT